MSQINIWLDLITWLESYFHLLYFDFKVISNYGMFKLPLKVEQKQKRSEFAKNNFKVPFETFSTSAF